MTGKEARTLFTEKILLDGGLYVGIVLKRGLRKLLELVADPATRAHAWPKRSGMFL